MLSRIVYEMIVYGPPFSWERILRLQAVEAVRWFEGEGDQVKQDVVTELVWKPGDVLLAVEIWSGGSLLVVIYGRWENPGAEAPRKEPP